MTGESQNQPSKFEEMLRGNFPKKQELITLLLACPSIADRASRDNLLRDVYNGRPIAKVPRDEVNETDVENIVNTLLKYSGALEELISFIQLKDSGTQALQALETFWSALLVDSFLSDNIEGKPTSTSEAVLEFVNQTNALTTLYSNFQVLNFVIDAPLGYGKTRLLEQVKVHFEEEGWAIHHVECDKLGKGQNLLTSIADSFGIAELTNIKSLEKMSGKVAGNLQQKIGSNKGIILIIDSVHQLVEEFRSESVRNFFSQIRNIAQSWGNDKKLRIILAGRYLSQYDLLPGCTTITLKPFTLDVIKQAVEMYYVGRKDPRIVEWYFEIAYHLYAYSGGHPRFISDIFVGSGEASIVNINSWFCNNQKSAYINKKIISPNIKEIKQKLDIKLWSALETLCVFRIFDISLLKYLQAESHLNWNDTPFKLVDKLTQARLINRTGPVLTDGILRPVILISLYTQKPTRFNELCNIAEKYFQEKFLETPDEKTLIELLYTRLIKHRKEALTEDHEQRANISISILNQFNKFVQSLIENEPTIEDKKWKLESLLTLLKIDWELEFLYNYTLRDENRLDLYNAWIEQIRTKAKELETENK
ncbi:MAG: AAA family ATPase [Chloroflexota bacterium]